MLARSISFLALAILLLPRTLFAQELETAWKRAGDERKLIVAEFSRQCARPPCGDVEDIAHPAIQRLLAEVIFVRLETNDLLREQHRIDGYPTYIVFDASKREFVRWQGSGRRDVFANRIKSVLEAASYVIEANHLRSRGETARAAIALGIGYRQINDFEEARRHFARAKEQTTDRSVQQMADINVALAWAHQRKSDFALRLLDAIAKVPVDVENEAAAWLAIAQIKHLLSDEKGAIEAYSRAERVAPRDSPLHRQALNGLAYFSSSVASLGGHAADASITLVRPATQVLAGKVKFQTIIRRADIARVEFLVDGNATARVDRPPFSAKIDLDNVPRQRRVEVVAYTSEGREVGRDAITINDRHDEFWVRVEHSRAHEETTIRADFNIPQGRRLAAVDFLLDDKKVAMLTEPPFVYKLRAGSAPAVLVAVATLDDGSRSEDAILLNSADVAEEVDVHLVELFTTVVDGSGAPVRGLTSDDFTIVENRQPQTIERFRETATDPMTIGLVVDTSGSMDLEMLDVQAAAASFLEQALRNESEAFLIDFDSTARLRQSTTRDLEALLANIRRLTARGSTALFDALVFGLLQFQDVNGKKALIVLTDGHDIESHYSFETAVKMAKQSRVPIYLILLDSDGRKYLPTGRLNPTKALLPRLAEDTGGRAYLLRKPEELGKVYGEIDRELRSQYLLTYRPRGGKPGAWRDIDVRVKKKGMRARAIAGYYAEE